MKSDHIKLTILSCIAAMGVATHGEAKPLKVYILAGQSNMEGHAQTKTFPAVAKDPKTADLYKEMVGADGKPVVCDNVWISYAYGDFNGNPIGRKAGKLTAGFGSQHHVGTGKIGPEFTFGITMHKQLNEPILLIKNAWGGKSLMVDFRPPSAGPLEDEKTKDAAGKYYALMLEHVKDVLADPKKVYPGYDPKEGYEVAGFVWFQGFNDLVGNYPRTDPSMGKKSPKDFSEYSRLLACFIRDVRKDLSVPDMPFVTGVLGVGGEEADHYTVDFRKAMAAPAEMEEFKGTVANVYTQKIWPADIDAIYKKLSDATADLGKQGTALTMRAKKGENVEAEKAKFDAEKAKRTENLLSEDEKWLLENGVSNKGFHYYGSAKFFAQAGKAFAEAILEMPVNRQTKP